METTIQKYDSLKLFADGGSRGNPGPSASGFVLLTLDDRVIIQRGIYLGTTTNNQAEYKSLKFGLEEAIKLGAKDVLVYMDSQLVIRQMLGQYRVKHHDILPLFMEIQDLLKQFDKVEFNHIPREFNKLADAQVNKSLDLKSNV